MTISENSENITPRDAYVWIWLPNETKPVVAGRIERSGEQLLFNYGQSYLNRSDSIPIYLPELPFEKGIPLTSDLDQALFNGI